MLHRHGKVTINSYLTLSLWLCGDSLVVHLSQALKQFISEGGRALKIRNVTTFSVPYFKFNSWVYIFKLADIYVKTK